MPSQVLNILIPKEPTGYKMVQLAGWTGICFIVPRSEMRELTKRQEAGNPGLYFLFGENDEATNQKLYIGESERFLDRLLSHDSNKDFWNVAVIFTGGLDKAKAKYLEFCALDEARKIGRYTILNTTIPRKNSLSEFDNTIAQDYFTKIKYILLALGYPIFESVSEASKDSSIYFLKKRDGVDARAQLLKDGSLYVQKGALARIKEADSFIGWAYGARRRFQNDGDFKDNGDGISFILTRDILFKSPSAAAATLTGRSINGWTAWRDEEGNTLDENLRK